MPPYQFQYPPVLWGLLIVPVLLLLFLAYLLWRRRAWARLGNAGLVKKLSPRFAFYKLWVRFAMMMLAVSMGVVMLANPRVQSTSGPDVRKGIDVILALDVSNSMLATDVKPNRLTAAKSMITALLQKEKSNRLALILFAGNAYLQVPLTYDYTSIDLFLRAATTGSVPSQGTAISNAMDKAKLAFASSEERYKSLIIITDGETHDDNAAQKAAELAAQGVTVHTVGIGTTSGSTITTTEGEKKDATGNTVLSRLNEEVLNAISSATRGRYIHFDNPANVANALRTELSVAGTKALADATLFEYDSKYYLFALPMLLLLAAELFVGDRRKIKK